VDDTVYYGNNIAVQAQDECSRVCAVPDEIKPWIRGLDFLQLVLHIPGKGVRPGLENECLLQHSAAFGHVRANS